MEVNKLYYTIRSNMLSGLVCVHVIVDCRCTFTAVHTWVGKLTVLKICTLGDPSTIKTNEIDTAKYNIMCIPAKCKLSFMQYLV